MTTSGTIQTNTEYESYFWVSWSQISQDVASNKTKIHWSCGVHCGHRFYYNAITMSSVTINGIQVYAGGTYSDFGNGDHEIASGDLDILHNSDGTKTFTVSGFTGWLYENHNYSASAQSFTLTTIPRASTMTVPSFTIGSSGTMTITRASSAFTHTIRYAFGSASGTVVTKTSSTSVSWTPPVSLLDQIPSSVSGSGTLYLDTYSGNTLIGTKQYSFTASAASSVKPSCSFTFSDPTGLRTTFGAYVQGRSKLAIAVTGTPNHSSPIKSYKVTVDGNEYNSASFTTAVLRGSGTLTIKATVTDARGRTSAESAQTITVLVYAAPVVTISAYRCNSSGAWDSEGAYMKFALSSVISSLNSQNSATWRIRYKKSTESSWTTLSGSGTSYTSSVIAADLSALYNVEATVTDRIVGTTKAASVPISYVLMDFYSSGRGIAFGRVATADGFACAMEAVFEDRTNLLGGWKPEGDNRSNQTSPSDYMSTLRWRGIKNKSAIGLGTSGYAYLFGLRGWADESGGHAHEIAFNDAGINVRKSVNETTWGAWQEIVTVSEEGDSSGWHYVKYTNGVAECWQRLTITDSIDQQFGSGYASVGHYLTYPSGLFTGNPPISLIDIASPSGYSWLGHSGSAGSVTQTPEFRFFRFGSANNLSFHVSVYARGRWK